MKTHLMQSTRAAWLVALVGCLWVLAGCASEADKGARQVNPNYDPNMVTGIAGEGGKQMRAPQDFGNTQSTPGTIQVLENPPGAAGANKCLRPTIMFVIDGSGSMCAPFGGSTRWTELRNVLLDEQNGLISRLDSRGEFGMLLYDGTIDTALAADLMAPMCASGGLGGLGSLFSGGFGAGGMQPTMPAGQMCMQTVEVPPAGSNAGAIRRAFPQQQLGGSTPTDKAMNLAVDTLVASLQGQDLSENPPYIILATDGAPNDVCIGGAGGDGSAQQAGVVQAVQRAWQSQITTFVISLADGDPALEAHLQEVARVGNPGDPMAVPFSPASPDQLNETLVGLLQTAFGCDLQ